MPGIWGSDQSQYHTSSGPEYSHELSAIEKLAALRSGPTAKKDAERWAHEKCIPLIWLGAAAELLWLVATTVICASIGKTPQPGMLVPAISICYFVRLFDSVWLEPNLRPSGFDSLFDSFGDFLDSLCGWFYGLGSLATVLLLSFDIAVSLQHHLPPSVVPILPFAAMVLLTKPLMWAVGHCKRAALLRGPAGVIERERLDRIEELEWEAMRECLYYYCYIRHNGTELRRPSDFADWLAARGHDDLEAIIRNAIVRNYIDDGTWGEMIEEMRRAVR